MPTSSAKNRVDIALTTPIPLAGDHHGFHHSGGSGT